MGIMDTIRGFFGPKQVSTKGANQAIAAVKAAAQASNYNQASIKAFQALEEVGRAYGNIEREMHVTAREYGAMLTEGGAVTAEDFMPIINSFEIAKYSPDEVTFDDYRNIESSLDTVVQKLKKPGKAVKKKGAKKQKKRRRPQKRATGAGTRKRRTRRSE